MRVNRQLIAVLRNPRLDRLFDVIPPLLALLLALLIASVMLNLMDANPVEAFQAMADGAFGTQNATAETLVKATPLIFVGIGICIAFRGGVINIGGEGQMIVGAVAGVAVAISFEEMSGFLLITLSLLAGFLAGALWGGLAGFLKAYFDVNEILSTIMLNQIAVQLMNYLLNGVMLDPEVAGTNNIPKTKNIFEQAQLPQLSITLPGPVADVFKFLGLANDPILFDRTRLHYGLVLAIVLGVITYVFLWRTSIGYRVRAVGKSQRASKFAGINVKRQTVLAMFLAGGMAGLAGVIQVLGLQYRLQTDGSPAGFTGNAGFNGIVAALFGGLHPVGTIPASVFFGSLLVGAQKLQREIQVSSSLIITINGLIVVFMVSSQIFIRRRARRRMALAAARGTDHEDNHLLEKSEPI
ncbi:MAG TPA: ABC transporter permease [Aggregatilineales bacterium]|nr:ABC transporter permease [Aggregatilineales bacterium]